MTLDPTPRKRKYVIRSNRVNEPHGMRSDDRDAHVEPEALDLDRIARQRHGRSREDLVREAAYARAAARGFRGGDPVADWLAAEAEVDARLREDAETA